MIKYCKVIRLIAHTQVCMWDIAELGIAFASASRAVLACSMQHDYHDHDALRSLQLSLYIRIERAESRFGFVCICCLLDQAGPHFAEEGSPHGDPDQRWQHCRQDQLCSRAPREANACQQGFRPRRDDRCYRRHPRKGFQR